MQLGWDVIDTLAAYSMHRSLMLLFPQAALDAFEAEEFSEFVGQLSSSAVAGLDPDIVSEREGVLTNTAQGSSTSGASVKASNATEAKEDDAAAEGETDDEDRERKVGAGWDAYIIEGSGWRVGLKGRKILIDFELFNIYSPTGMLQLLLIFKLPMDCSLSIVLTCYTSSKLSGLLILVSM